MDTMPEYAGYDGRIDSDGLDDEDAADTSNAAAMAASGPLPPVIPSINSNSGGSMINNQDTNSSTLQAPLAQQTAPFFPAVAPPLLVQQQFFPPPQQFLVPPPLAAQRWNTAPQTGIASNFVTGNFFQAPQLQLVDPSDTALPPQDLGSKQSMEGFFRSASDSSHLNFNNLLLLQPNFVRALERQHHLADCTLILQYFIQVVMTYPSQEQHILERIFARRNNRLNPTNPLHELHELDPLRKFANTNGVPPRGFVPTTSPVVQLRPGTKYSRGETGFQLPGYLSNRAPVPIGTTLHELAWWYPNHCHYELCDAFLQHDLTNEAAGRAMSQDVRNKMVNLEVAETGNHVPSAVTNRLRARKRILREWLSKKSGSVQALAQIEAYLDSKIKVFEVGEPVDAAQIRIVPGRSSTIHSAEFTNLRKKIAEEQAMAQQAQQGSTPSTRSPSTLGPSPASDLGPASQDLTPASSVSSSTQHSKSSKHRAGKINASNGGSTQSQRASSTPASSIDCVSTIDHPLGRVGQYQFWSNHNECKDFLAKTSSGRQRQTKLLQYIVSHDPYAQIYDPATMASFTKIVVRCIRHSIAGTKGGASLLVTEDNNDEISFGSKQLYRELSGHVRALDDDSGSATGAEAVSRIKDAGILTLQEEDRALTMILAAKVAAIISGERTSILEDADLMSGLLPEPQTGSHTTITDFQGKFCGEKDPLSYALAVRIIKGANRAFEETVSPLEYLSEVKVQCSDLLDTCKKGVEVLDVPLDAKLMEQGVDALELLLNFTTGRVDGMLRSRNKAPTKRKREEDTGAVEVPSPKIQQLDNDLTSRAFKKPIHTKAASLSPRPNDSVLPAVHSNWIAVQSSAKCTPSPPSPRKRSIEELEDFVTSLPITANKRNKWDSGYHSFNESSSSPIDSPPGVLPDGLRAGASDLFLDDLGTFTSAGVGGIPAQPKATLDLSARNDFEDEFDRFDADYTNRFGSDQGADEFAMNLHQDLGAAAPGGLGIGDVTEHGDEATSTIELEVGQVADVTGSRGSAELTEADIEGWRPQLGAELDYGMMYERFSFDKDSDDFSDGKVLYFQDS